MRDFKRRDFLMTSAGAMAFAASGCATGQQPDIANFSWELRRPESAGVNAAALPAVRAAIQQKIDSNALTGAVSAFARNNKLVWYEAQGLRDVEAGEPMRRDDIFRMMSSTKVVTTVAIMMMSDAGRLDIDDPVSRYVPSFANPRVAIGPEGWQSAHADPEALAALRSQIRIVPAQREITIKDLLTHTSGLSSSFGAGTGPGTLVNDAAEDARAVQGATLSERIPRLGQLVLDFEPGSRFGYSPLDGMDTLLHIVELVSGQEAEAFLTERIFVPLDMIDTYFNVPAAKQSRVIPLYERRDNVWQRAAPMFGGAPTTYISGAGGLLSTAHDFLNFEIMLLNGGVFNGRRLLRPETVLRMRTNQVGNLFAEWIPPITSGLGFGLGGRVVLESNLMDSGRGVGSYGWGGGYGTESWIDPERNVAAVYFVQQGSTGASYARSVGDALL